MRYQASPRDKVVFNVRIVFDETIDPEEPAGTRSKARFLPLLEKIKSEAAEGTEDVRLSEITVEDVEIWEEQEYYSRTDR